MIPAFGWRLRWELEVFGPRTYVQQLYGAARYMPDDAVWEYCDSSEQWYTHISVGQWRQYLYLIRKCYLHKGGPRAAPTEDLSLEYTYWPYYKRLVVFKRKERRDEQKRIVQCRVVTGFENLVPFNPGQPKPERDLLCDQ